MIKNDSKPDKQRKKRILSSTEDGDDTFDNETSSNKRNSKRRDSKTSNHAHKPIQYDMTVSSDSEFMIERKQKPPVFDSEDSYMLTDPESDLMPSKPKGRRLLSDYTENDDSAYIDVSSVSESFNDNTRVEIRKPEKPVHEPRKPRKPNRLPDDQALYDKFSKTTKQYIKTRPKSVPKTSPTKSAQTNPKIDNDQRKSTAKVPVKRQNISTNTVNNNNTSDKSRTKQKTNNSKMNQQTDEESSIKNQATQTNTVQTSQLPKKYLSPPKILSPFKTMPIREYPIKPIDLPEEHSSPAKEDPKNKFEDLIEDIQSQIYLARKNREYSTPRQARYASPPSSSRGLTHNKYFSPPKRINKAASRDNINGKKLLEEMKYRNIENIIQKKISDDIKSPSPSKIPQPSSANRSRTPNNTINSRFPSPDKFSPSKIIKSPTKSITSSPDRYSSPFRKSPAKSNTSSPEKLSSPIRKSPYREYNDDFHRNNIPQRAATDESSSEGIKRKSKNQISPDYIQLLNQKELLEREINNLELKQSEFSTMTDEEITLITRFQGIVMESVNSYLFALTTAVNDHNRKLKKEIEDMNTINAEISHVISTGEKNFMTVKFSNDRIKREISKMNNSIINARKDVNDMTQYSLMTSTKNINAEAEDITSEMLAIQAEIDNINNRMKTILNEPNPRIEILHEEVEKWQQKIKKVNKSQVPGLLKKHTPINRELFDEKMALMENMLSIQKTLQQMPEIFTSQREKLTEEYNSCMQKLNGNADISLYNDLKAESKRLSVVYNQQEMMTKAVSLLEQKLNDTEISLNDIENTTKISCTKVNYDYNNIEKCISRHVDEFMYHIKAKDSLKNVITWLDRNFADSRNKTTALEKVKAARAMVRRKNDSLKQFNL